MAQVLSGDAWWVVEGQAHLLHPHSGHPRHATLSESWCSRTIPPDSQRADYEIRCPQCLRYLQTYVEEATKPLPEVVVETVVVEITRPQDSDRTLVDLIETAVRRRRTWADFNVRSQTIRGLGDEVAE